jgi:hypothetical protein
MSFIETIDIPRSQITSINNKGGKTKMTIVFDTKPFDSETLGHLSKLSDEDIIVNVHMDVLALVNKKTGVVQDKDQMKMGGGSGF